MKHTKIAALVVAATAMVGLSACSERPAEVSKSNDATVAAGETGDSVVTDEPAPENDVVVEEAETDTEAFQTATLGDTVEVGDWSVKVTEVALNANEALANPNFYNEKPKGQYVLVTYEATYNGPERTASAWELTWTITTNDQKIWDSGYATTPADNVSWTSDARKGGTVKQQVMFDVNPKNLPDSILSVEGYDENFDIVYADFPL